MKKTATIILILSTFIFNALAYAEVDTQSIIEKARSKSSKYQELFAFLEDEPDRITRLAAFEQMLDSEDQLLRTQSIEYGLNSKDSEMRNAAFKYSFLKIKRIVCNRSVKKDAGEYQRRKAAEEIAKSGDKFSFTITGYNKDKNYFEAEIHSRYPFKGYIIGDKISMNKDANPNGNIELSLTATNQLVGFSSFLRIYSLSCYVPELN